MLRALAAARPRPHAPPPAPHRSAGRGFFRNGRAEIPFSGFGAAAQAGRENSLLQRWIAANGKKALTDDVREQVAEQACTNHWPLCVPWMAEWRDVSPDSKGVARYVRALDGSALLSDSPGRVLDAVQGLLLEEAPPRATPIRRARLANRLYHRYYSHAAPFSPDRLEALWKRCTADSPGECTEGRRRMQKLVQQGVGEKVAEHAKAR